MKWRSASCLLIFALTLSLNAQSPNPQEPVKFTCDIGHYQDNRPEKWELLIRKEFADGKKTAVWNSEHDSIKSATKACDKLLKDQHKIWKENLKGNNK